MSQDKLQNVNKYRFPLLMLARLAILAFLVVSGVILIPNKKAIADQAYNEDYGSSAVSTYVMRSGYNVQKLAKQYTPSSAISVGKVSFKLYRVSSDPTTAQFYVKIYQGGTNPENGTLLSTSAYVASASLSSASTVSSG